ncbi:Phospholipase D1 [Rhizophlyctis rosea]|nr:Phospholipase D1 [Rhizophlyctis rosea]
MERFRNAEAIRTPIRALKSYFGNWGRGDEAVDVDEEMTNAEDWEHPFISGSDLNYPEPKFEELEIKHVKIIPFNRQHWYSGRYDRLGDPHALDSHELEFRHKPTGTHWIISMRPKDLLRLSRNLTEPHRSELKHFQRRIKKLAKVEPRTHPRPTLPTEEGPKKDGEEDATITINATDIRPALPKLKRGLQNPDEILQYLHGLLAKIKEPWNVVGENHSAIEERRRGLVICAFIELSRTSLIGTVDGVKCKEGWVRKRRGGRKNDVLFLPDFLVPRLRQRRWLALRSNYLLYFYSPTEYTPREVLLIDGYFQILHRFQRREADLRPKDDDDAGDDDDDRVATRPGGRRHFNRNALALRPFNTRTNEVWAKDEYHIAILNGFRDLLITVAHEHGSRSRKQLVAEWVRELQQRRDACSWYTLTQTGKGRYDGFAPVRDGLSPDVVRWMIDGSAHFEQILAALEGAEKEILIADWWLSPEVYLNRGPEGIHAEQLQTRLDRVLIRKANEGVRIYILLYKEINLYNASFHAKEILMGRKPPNYMLDPSIEDPHHEFELKCPDNIVVLRHPDQGRGFTGVVLDSVIWAHHEKIAAIDRKIAFVGGIDLCFGRFDTAEHTLKDDVVYKPATGEIEQHSSSDTLAEEGPGFSPPASEVRDPAMPDQGKSDNNAPARHEMDSTPINNLFPGQDFSNPRIKDFVDVGKKPFECLVDRTNIARLPWHDVSMTFRKPKGDEALEGPVDDLVWHFIQRWNFAKWEKRKVDHHIPWLYPSQGVRRATPEESRGTIQLQLLRSAAQWSAGSPKEKSIQNAYKDLIYNAQHYVYIENQFFISKYQIEKDWKANEGQKFPKSNVRIHNSIARVLAKRIIRAHENKENFRAYIVIPLFPAFHGDVRRDDSDPALPYVLAAQTETVRGLMTEIEKGGVPNAEIQKYVLFLGLRKWDILGKRLVTEQVYIHAKTMIVDDRHVIIGSANINDRSQMGSRDSEVACLVTDTHCVTTTMNGQKFDKANYFAYTMRLRLFHEHLGIPFPEHLRDVHDPTIRTDWRGKLKPVFHESCKEIADPVSDACWKLWLDRGDQNAEAFRAVFHCVPDDTVKNWKQYQDFLKTRGGKEEEEVEESMDHMAKEQGVLATIEVDGKPGRQILEERVKGHVVRFPIYFLEEEDLSMTFKGLSKLAPRIVFT